MLFKTITNPDSFSAELLEKQQDQASIDAERQQMAKNPVVRLMQACVDVNDWDTLDDIINGVYEGKFDLTMAPELLKTCFKALNWMIEPLYRPLSVSNQVLTARFKNLKKAFTINYKDSEETCNIQRATTPEILVQ